MHKPTEIRCPNCDAKIAEALGPTHIQTFCKRCKTDFEFTNLKKDKIIVESKIEK